MAQTTTLRLRGWWMSIHKWIGILLAVLIIPISVTGSALVWHDWLDETINPARFEVKAGEAALTPSGYAAAAQKVLGAGERVATIRYPEGGEGPLMVSASRPPVPGEGRPVRTNVWLDPADGRVTDTAASSGGLVQVLHVLHGSMMIPGGWGRPIVGWVGVFMFISCLTGIWLWWPVTGSVKRGFRWKRQNSTNANLHHQMGFWILVPLAMLSFTGFWISFPSVFSSFERPKAEGKASGGGREGRGERGKGGEKAGPPDRARQMRARPLEQTALSVDQAVAAAQPHATGALVSITYPTDLQAEWRVSFARQGGPAEVTIADATSEVTPPRPVQPETRARLMRRLHDGTNMGVVWQIVIFIGGIIPALLSITGLVMWWRSRGWKAEIAKKRKAKAARGAVPQPAE